MKVAAVALVGMALLAVLGCDRKPSVGAQKEGAAQRAAMETPKRAPGLWAQRMSLDSGAPVRTTVCLDAATDQRLAFWGSQSDASSCQEFRVVRAPDGSWNFSSACRGDKGSSISYNGKANGDFNSRYQVTGNMVITGSAVPELAGSHDFLIDAEYISACPADMAPGMMDIPGQGRINALTAAREFRGQ